MKVSGEERLKNIKQGAQAIFGLAIIALFIWGLIKAFGCGVRAFKNIDPDLAIALITASGVVVASALSIVLGKYYEVQAVAIRELRQKKTPIYDEIIGTLFRHCFPNS